MLTRRMMFGILIVSLGPISRSVAQIALPDVLPRPDPKTFQAGDFIWPKKPGDYVLYKAPIRPDLLGGDVSPTEDERRWLAERDQFVASASTSAPHLTSQEIERLRSMSFAQFYTRYVGDQVPNTPGVYLSGPGIYVGHVGIIDIDEAGEIWVIEALWGGGVVRRSYQDWLRSRPQELIWHGRVRDVPAENRAHIAAEAKRYVGRPYSFWNFDLADERDFYCSKLAWLAIWRALGLSIDGNPQPKRSFWFSPKQLLYLRTITRLHDPGPYANPIRE